MSAPSELGMHVGTGDLEDFSYSKRSGKSLQPAENAGLVRNFPTAARRYGIGMYVHLAKLNENAGRRMLMRLIAYGAKMATVNISVTTVAGSGTEVEAMLAVVSMPKLLRHTTKSPASITLFLLPSAAKFVVEPKSRCHTS
jgi:hypothetical protein